jgi:hypothetical protein
MEFFEFAAQSCATITSVILREAKNLSILLAAPKRRIHPDTNFKIGVIQSGNGQFSREWTLEEHRF